MNHFQLKSFYFLRHGQTDWNKNQSGLCADDDIELNAVGIEQAKQAAELIVSLSLPINDICSSPLRRAMQTAEHVGAATELAVQQCAGLASVDLVNIKQAMNAILADHEYVLIVSHGEVYRQLLILLSVQTEHANAANGGLYCFVAPSDMDGAWTVQAVEKE